MRIEDAPLTFEAARVVLENPCGAHRAEQALSGAADPARFDMAQKLIAAGAAGCIVMIEGEPAAFFLHVQATPSVFGAAERRIVFVATEIFWRAGLPAVRWSRRYLTITQMRHPGVRFRAVNAAKGDRVGPWLRTMGFRPIEHRDDGRTVYELEPLEDQRCAT